MSIILALPAQKLVLNAYSIFTGTTPSNTTFLQHTAWIDANGEAAYISFLNTVAKDIPVATLASNLLTNLGLTAAFTQAEAVAYLTTNASNLAGAMTSVANAVLNYVSDTTNTKNAELLAAKTAWTNTATNALAYSSAIANTSAGSMTATAAGTTFTLTTGVADTNGTAGADIFNAILGTGATFNTFDTINGLAGEDILNISDSTAAAFALPASTTIAGIETVNLSRAAAAAATSIGVTVVDTTFGTGVKSLSVVEAGLAQTAAAASVTLASAETVSVISTGATKFNGVTVADTTAVAATTGSTLKTVTIKGASTTANAIWGNAVTAVSIADTGAVATVVNAAAGTREMTVTTSGTTQIGGFTDATATTLNINNSGAVALGTFTAAKATTINYSSTAANTSATITGAVATSLNVSGTKLATIALAVNPALTTINVTGSAGLTLTAATNAATDYAALALIDTSGTTGILTAATLGTATAVTGGAGNDNITVGATTKAINLGGSTAIAAVAGTSNAIAAGNVVTLASGTTAMGSGGSINGGTGSADVLSMVAADAAALTTSGAAAAGPTAFRAAVTGFETLQLAAAAGAIAVDKKAVGTTFTKVALAGSANLVTLNNIDNNDTVQVTGANAGGVTLAGSSGSGVDTLNIKLVNTGNALAAFGTFTTPNTETVVITSTDAQVTPVGYYNSMTLVDTAASSITVNGNSGLDLTFAGTALTTFDASGVTLGGVKFTSGAQAYAVDVKGTVKGGDTLNFNSALAATTITATAGTNALTGSNTVASTITGGTGADTISAGSGADIINGGAGADVIYADNAGAKRVENYVITTAGAGTATLTLGGVATTVTYATTGDNTIQLLNTALGNDARYGTSFTSSVTLATGTTTDDTLVVTWLADGTNIGSATTSATTLVINTTGTNATAVAGTQVTAGVVGTSGKNVITGGTGADTFIFGAASTAPSATVFQTITDFGSASDIIDYSVASLTIQQSSTASTGVAAISSVGVATFAAGDSTLALRLIAVEAGIQTGTAAAGQVAMFQMDSDAYVFISNGVDGVGAGDQLIKLTGVSTTDTAFNAITLSGGDMTLA